VNVHHLYVDFKQAHDSIQRKKLYTIMYEFGITPKLVRLVRATMTRTEAQVKVQTDLTTTFKIEQGLKQGNGLAPMIFNLVLEYVIRKLPVDANGTLEFKMCQIVGYADDICLLGRSLRSLKDMYQDLRINAKEVGLKISVNKTKSIFQTHSKQSGSAIGNWRS
jgi:hypothetical protein